MTEPVSPDQSRAEASVQAPLLSSPQAEAVRYGSAMLRRFGWFYYVTGLSRTLRRIPMDEPSAHRIREAAARGPVVYVLLRASTTDHLALNTALNRRRLPLSLWANGFSSFTWQPVREAWADVGRRIKALLRLGPPDPVESGWVTRTIASGYPITLFIWGRRTAGQWLSRMAAPDPLLAVIQAQEICEKPIQLVPIVVSWNRAPDISGSPVRNFIQAARERPGPLIRLVNLLASSHDATIQVGEAVDLGEFITRVPEARRETALRTLLRRYLRREHQVIRGPRLLPASEMQRLVLDNPPMRQHARDVAQQTGTSFSAVLQRQHKEYLHIAARFRWWVIRLLYLLLYPLWTRVFSGVDIRPDDLERIRQAMRLGTAVLVPTHKSHFDYLLLSWLFYKHKLIPPHVVAGENLAIWPISFFLRGAGGFFIRRRFRGELIHPVVFSRYLRELIHQGYPVEFFIEGGRTRTGKLLPAKTGVLGMVLDAADLRRASTEVTILPMSLAYEQVAEEQAYARELGGEAKRPESLQQVVGARRVFGRRFGKVYCRVGTPYPTSSFVDASPEQPAWSARTEEVRQEELQRLGATIMHRIGRCTVVLPSSVVALALLAHPRRGIKQVDLESRIERFRAFLEHLEAPIADSMDHFSHARVQALQRFADQGLISAHSMGNQRVWGIDPDGRITLAFYANMLLHYLAPHALLATVWPSTHRERSIPVSTLTTRFSDLKTRLDREFCWDPDLSDEHMVLGALEQLVAMQIVSVSRKRATILHNPQLEELGALIRSLLEGYALMLREIEPLVTNGELHPKSLGKAVLDRKDAYIEAAAVSRPEALSLETLVNAAHIFTNGPLFERSDSTSPTLHSERWTSEIALWDEWLGR